MKSILFGITSLTIGGAEKVLVDIVNKLNNKYDITIFTIYAKGEFEKLVPKNVKIKSLYSKPYLEMSKIKKLLISIRLLILKKHIYNKYIKGNYDTEIAFLEGPITSLFSIKNDNTKKIAWVHTDISKIFGNTFKAKIKKKVNKDIYKNYDKIVLVSKDSLSNFKNVNSKIEDDKLIVINNYINSENVIKKADENIELPFRKNEINFVEVARLVEAKAIDRLIEVHARLIKEGFSHNIYIIGDGPLKEDLQKQIDSKKVSDTFHLQGSKENPYPYIKNADYFCLLSNFEGYPMVLEEAKILNKFIIITNTASKEVLENYKNSIILENNEDAIYEGLKEIIQNKDKYEIDTSTKEKYDNSSIIEKIVKII